MPQHDRGRGQRRSGGGRPWPRGRGRGGSTTTPSNVPPPKRPMEHIASVSRSSGLEADGDTLKDWKIQEEYRDFLQKKVLDLFAKYPPESEKGTRERKESEANLLILFRKLREGIYASSRTDDFALEAYETSLFLSTLFSSPVQVTSIISHLLPDLYTSTSSSPSSHSNLPITVLLSLLHRLVEGYPSQKSYYQLVSALSTNPSETKVEFLPPKASHIQWIRTVAESLRRGNYSRFERETRASIVDKLLASNIEDKLASLSLMPADVMQYLPNRALRHLLSALRAKSRQTTWAIFRSAYRELSCFRTDPAIDTPMWLERSLCLNGFMKVAAEEWLEGQVEKGATRRKEGVEGRWIVLKVR